MHLEFARTDAPGTWIWRVNVTEIGGLDQRSQPSNSTTDPSQKFYATNTQWQLDWPGNSDNFDSFLWQQNLTAQFTAIIFSPPPQVGKYNDNDNGDCAPIFGDNCTQAIRTAASRGDPIFLSNMDGCRKYTTTEQSNIGFELVPRNISPLSNSTENTELRRGETLSFSTTEAYAASNKTVIQDSEQALQLFIMNLRYEDTQNINVGTSNTTVLCRIVKKNAGSPAIRWHPSILASWGLVMSFLLVW